MNLKTSHLRAKQLFLCLCVQLAYLWQNDCLGGKPLFTLRNSHLSVKSNTP
ncbi:hypothetical protein PF005_g18519 [Phytophthora fragariae]|uniref:RxLR effector protein n=1 Tax=Phytophthora fragariae TaxID=53985 RepID=A0A6A4CZ47_9STRA|nr:hypothetical protein PF003_g18501 [Phytophthora fragariae]KAE8930320.1 hypothetical protein PF009_g19589 [Phytophthora fragariae]KAE9019901.1 hypothetical protein PF011_g5633 [Phytophthora fragariae]KAE9067714.1 hypothetical protein PF010_g27355 [Phytophthora fragariae]KAE9080162.1 hypothetical protein PF006_g27371 [Phytophthora fragariae]